MIGYPSIPEAVGAVEAGDVDEAIVPIENALEGTVSTTVDLLIHDTDLKIRAELLLPVRHMLAGIPGSRLDEIRVVLSHPQALGQCRAFLRQRLPEAEQVAALSTAAAVATVMREGDRSVAAIGPKRAVDLYGAVVLAADVQDAANNVTRFFVLARDDAEPTGRDRTSLCFSVKRNVPGAIHEVLTDLADLHIQMTKIESRPMKSALGDYYFLIDIEGHRRDPVVAEMLRRIATKTAQLKVFGSYPRDELAISGSRIPRV